MAREHLDALMASGTVTPHLVAGIDETAGRAFAAKHGFRSWSDDPLQVVVDPDVDLVVIASPSEHHALQAMAAADAGKHVLIEIPIATRIADATALQAVAKRATGRIMPAYTSRYYPALAPLIDPRHSAMVGRWRQFVASMGTDKRTNRNQAGEPRDWIDDLVWHHGMHVFDVMLTAMQGDAIESVVANEGTRHPEHGGVMDVHVLVEFASGALATIALTYHAQDQFTHYTFVRDGHFASYRQGPAADGHTELMQGKTFRDLVREQDGAFLHAIRAGTPPPITVGDVMPGAWFADRVERALSAPRLRGPRDTSTTPQEKE